VLVKWSDDQYAMARYIIMSQHNYGCYYTFGLKAVCIVETVSCVSDIWKVT